VQNHRDLAKFLRGSVAMPREIRDEQEAVTASSVRDRADRGKLLTSGSHLSSTVRKQTCAQARIGARARMAAPGIIQRAVI
jgi:hypothetical protein